MPLSPLQKTGIITGCIPIVSVVVGIIKFFVYWHREAEFEESLAKHPMLQKGAVQVDQLAKEALPKGDPSLSPSNLKWYALLQVIPLVGIFGALEEEKFLEANSAKINKIAKKNLGVEKKEPGEEKKEVKSNKQSGEVEKKKQSEKKEVELNPETYRAYAAQVVEKTPSEQIPIQLTQVSYQLEREEGDFTWVPKETVKEITIDRKKFVAFLLRDKKLIFSNATLLINTLCKNDLPLPNVLKYSNFSASPEMLQSFRDQVPSNQPVACTLTRDFFDYLEKGGFYVDFANARSFGGAYNTYGCVQEERMFAEFLALALLDFITDNGVHCVADYDAVCRGYYPPHVAPAPFIVEGIKRDFDISRTPYGTAFQRVETAEAIVQAIRPVEDSVPVNIIGIAAVDYRGSALKYTLPDLLYHFDACVLSNLGAKEVGKSQGEREREAPKAIHTADWGCGAFLNSVKMIAAIQYLAAKVTQTPLVLHGIGNVKKEYTEELVNGVIEEINQWVQEGKTPQTILETLLKRSENDADWRPRKDN